MDSLSRMTKMNLPPFLQSAAANATGNASSPFPPGVMNSFLLTAGQASPLMEVFLFVYRQIGSQFGLDPSVLLTLAGVFWVLSKVFLQLYTILQNVSLRYFSCCLSVSENDDIYRHVMNFLAQQRDVASDRFLMAQTVWKSAWEEEEEMANNMSASLVPKGDDSEPKYLNFANQVAQSVSLLLCWGILDECTDYSPEPAICS